MIPFQFAGLEDYSHLESEGMHLGEMAFIWGLNEFESRQTPAEFLDVLPTDEGREDMDVNLLSRLDFFNSTYRVLRDKQGRYFAVGNSRYWGKGFCLGSDRLSARDALLEILADDKKCKKLFS